MSQSTGAGRLGNQIFRNIACSIIAEKFDLKVNYNQEEIIKKIGINLYSGNKVYDQTIFLRDNNYFDVLNSSIFEFNFDPSMDYFQTKEISCTIYRYVNDKLKENIINTNIYKERYGNNNDCFIHIRLGDVISYNPGLDYYLKVLEKLNFDNLYIASDSLHHEIVKSIVEKYPYTKLLLYDEVNTIQYGSTNKYVILSHGSFSATIGYLSFFSEVYYPQYDKNRIWYGDMFSIEGWNEIKLYE